MGAKLSQEGVRLGKMTCWKGCRAGAGVGATSLLQPRHLGPRAFPLPAPAPPPAPLTWPPPRTSRRPPPGSAVLIWAQTCCAGWDSTLPRLPYATPPSYPGRACSQSHPEKGHWLWVTSREPREEGRLPSQALSPISRVSPECQS